MKVTCVTPGCTRHVWFTAEQLCRPHGLAAGVHLDPVAVREDAMFASPAAVPAPARSRSPKRSASLPVDSTVTLSEGENDG